MTQIMRWLVLALVALLGQGCLSAGIYRTARTLSPGRGDVGLTWNATRLEVGSVETTDSNGNPTTTDGINVVLPNIVPEIAYHIGVVDNFEMGGRLSPATGYIEIDGKWRFHKSEDDKMHLALQPALGYSALLLVEGVTATLPLIFTYDITRQFSINLAPYVAYQSYNPLLDVVEELAGTYLQIGGSVGMVLRGRKFYVMPSLDYAHAAADFSGAGDFLSFPSQNYMRFGITIGFVSGEELESLDRIEKKLDVIQEEINDQNDEKEKKTDEEDDEEKNPSTL